MFEQDGITAEHQRSYLRKRYGTEVPKNISDYWYVTNKVKEVIKEDEQGRDTKENLQPTSG